MKEMLVAVLLLESVTGHVSIDMTNRKVAGKESVTTPAGIWDCYKITYHSKMVFRIGIGIPMNMDVTEWYAPGFGSKDTIKLRRHSNCFDKIIR